jgi:flagellar basal-body rod protein FlgF
MIQGLYSATTALTAASRRQDIIADNLAHATVPGFRARGLAFSTFGANDPATETTSQDGQIRGTDASREFISFQPGEYQETGNPLEMAIKGDGFFSLQGPSGPVYTRNGSFELNAEGQLQSKSGLIVNGTGGPISIPAGTARVNVGSDGSVSADGAQVGQIGVTTFQDPGQLVRVGPTLFDAPAGSGPQPSEAAQILQGYREGANVGVIQEMVNLIAGSRYYEAASKALRTLSDTLQQRTQPQQA